MISKEQKQEIKTWFMSIINDLTTNYSKIDNVLEEIDKYLKSEGGVKEFRDTKGKTLLHCIAANQSYYSNYDLPLYALVKLINYYELDIDAQDYFRDTPLLLAAQYGHIKLIDKLLELGVDSTKRNSEGNNIFHCAAVRRPNTYLYLLHHPKVKADLNAKNKDGKTAEDILNKRDIKIDNVKPQTNHVTNFKPYIVPLDLPSVSLSELFPGLIDLFNENKLQIEERKQISTKTNHEARYNLSLTELVPKSSIQSSHKRRLDYTSEILDSKKCRINYDINWQSRIINRKLDNSKLNIV
jgi:hypothetical protein